MKTLNTPTLKIALAAVAIIAAPLLLVGCNTMEGAGTDIKHAGRALENAAEDAKQPCPPSAPCPPQTRSYSRR